LNTKKTGAKTLRENTFQYLHQIMQFRSSCQQMACCPLSNPKIFWFEH